MKQEDLFTTPPKPTHYGPTPTPGLPGWRRASLCGVIYAIGGGPKAWREATGEPEVFGTSNLDYVTCEECLRRAAK